MIDYNKIGARIAEERKYIRHISQEQMAIDLGMYQADISNLEHARKSSGINDLYKLEMIADYFDLPIENLLFGTSMEAHMIKYYGSKMEITPVDPSHRFKTTKHRQILKKVMNIDPAKATISAFSCGPYTVYIGFEELKNLVNFEDLNDPQNEGFLRWHLYTFFNDVIIGNMTVSVISLFDILNEKRFEYIHSALPEYIIDLEKVQRKVNPYIRLLDAVDGEEQGELHRMALQRMDDLRPEWNTAVFLIESAYVMEDCRRHGIFRLMLDVLKQQKKKIIWLNLEPSMGEDLDNSDAFFAEYVEAEAGQMNLNAMIAEKVGLTVDPDTVKRYTKTVDIDGNQAGNTVDVRKYAYYIPDKIQEIIAGDGPIAKMGKSIDEIEETLEEKPDIELAGDIYSGSWKKGGSIVSIKMLDKGRVVYAFKRGFRREDAWYGVSYKNPAPKGEVVSTIVQYKTLEQALNSPYAAGFALAEQIWAPIPEEYIKI